MMLTKKDQPTKKFNHEEIWDEYGKMIMGIAHKISKSYGQDYDELLSEGILGVFTKLEQWDPARSALSTFIHQKATFKMLDFCIKPQRQIPTEVNPEEGPFLEKEFKPNNWLKNLFAEISEEAKILVSVIIESPEELYNAIKPTRPIRSKTALRNYLMDVLDWGTKDVERIFAEVTQCL